MNPTPATLKALAAVSGNVCAFPGCFAPIYDTGHGKLVGEACHIKAQRPNGPRYDLNQTDQERNGFDNLVYMCSPHHTVIDDPAKINEYTVEVLQSYKSDHESRNYNTILNEDVLIRLVMKVLELQTEASTPPPPSLVPDVEILMTSADNQMRIDLYGVRVKLRNKGQKTVRNFRLEVGIPNAYANPTHQSSISGNVRQVRGSLTVYRHTQEHFPNFVLYPDDTSDIVMNIDYQLRFDQYKDVNESIKVTLYSDDNLTSVTEYAIAQYRNKDRMDQLGLSGR